MGQKQIRFPPPNGIGYRSNQRPVGINCLNSDESTADLKVGRFRQHQLIATLDAEAADPPDNRNAMVPIAVTSSASARYRKLEFCCGPDAFLHQGRCIHCCERTEGQLPDWKPWQLDVVRNAKAWLKRCGAGRCATMMCDERRPGMARRIAAGCGGITPGIRREWPRAAGAAVEQLGNDETGSWSLADDDGRVAVAWYYAMFQAT